MKKEIADKWVDALRSGKYKQGTEHMRVNDMFCCFGVLCDLHAQAHPDIAAQQTSRDEYMGEDQSLPNEVMAWADILFEDGGIEGSAIIIKGRAYASLNDANDMGVSFKQIAKWIEKNYKLL